MNDKMITKYYEVKFWDSNDGTNYDGEKMGKRDTCKRVITCEVCEDWEQKFIDFDAESKCWGVLSNAGWCDGFMFCSCKEASKSQIEAYNYAMKLGVKYTPFNYYKPSYYEDIAGIYGAYYRHWTKKELKEQIKDYASIWQ